MLFSSLNLSQSFNYTPYLFYKKRFKSEISSFCIRNRDTFLFLISEFCCLVWRQPCRTVSCPTASRCSSDAFPSWSRNSSHTFFKASLFNLKVSNSILSGSGAVRIRNLKASRIGILDNFLGYLTLTHKIFFIFCS
jgi:hypothetical protein